MRKLPFYILGRVEVGRERNVVTYKCSKSLLIHSLKRQSLLRNTLTIREYLTSLIFKVISGKDKCQGAKSWKHEELPV